MTVPNDPPAPHGPPEAKPVRLSVQLMHEMLARAKELATRNTPNGMLTILRGSKEREIRSLIAAIAEKIEWAYAQTVLLERRVAKLEKAAESRIIVP